MIKLNKLCKYIDNLLKLKDFPNDHSNNGLQVEGKKEIKKAVFAVDASLELFETAVKKNADFIFVHHGLSWCGGFKKITGLDAERISALLKNGISLYGAHLPLDAHPQIGHNARIADIVSLSEKWMFAEYDGNKIGVAGKVKKNATPEVLSEILCRKLNTKYVIYGDSSKKIKTAGVISGGSGTEGILQAVDEGIDFLITGEIGHCSYHTIKESGIVAASFGHYCTEIPGITALMEHMIKHFDLNCEFIDIPTGL